MKVASVFTQVFAVFSFLTLGSLLIIVSMHILSVEDAVSKLRGVYESPWESLRTGFVGLLFIMVGLSFAKTLVKKGKQTEILIFRGEGGDLMVSAAAVEDVIRKILKRFHLVKDYKIKSIFHGRSVEIRLRLVLWSGGKVPDLLAEIQNEVRARLGKLLGPDIQYEMTCDVQRIEDHEIESVRAERDAYITS